jgi:hypothetical protein
MAKTCCVIFKGSCQNVRLTLRVRAGGLSFPHAEREEYNHDVILLGILSDYKSR